jgi:PII-like signaling protein
VCKRDGVRLAAPQTAGEHEFHKLMVYGSERPLHEELVRRLRASRASGATTVRGIWGFHGAHAPHGDRLLQLRRHVPTVTIVVDRPERTAASFAIVDELTGERGLVTSELVPAAGEEPRLAR